MSEGDPRAIGKDGHLWITVIGSLPLLAWRKPGVTGMTVQVAFDHCVGEAEASIANETCSRKIDTYT